MTSLKALLTRLTLLGGTALGISDADLPPIVRAAIPLAAALVLAVMEFAEHQSAQTDAALSVEAARVASSQAQAVRAPQGPPALTGDTMAAAMAAAGAALESARVGTVATGAHHRQDTAVLPRVSGEDYPTQAIGVVPAVPSTPVIGA